jgi:hypothetical protein
VYLLNQAENSISRDEYSKALEFYNQYTSQKKILEIDDLFNKFYCEALMSASPKFGQKEVVKITKFNNFKDKLRDEKEFHRITNCICH